MKTKLLRRFRKEAKRAIYIETKDPENIKVRWRKDRAIIFSSRQEAEAYLKMRHDVYVERCVYCYRNRIVSFPR